MHPMMLLCFRCAERREADAGAGGLLRALGRGRARRLLRRPGRVAGRLGRAAAPLRSSSTGVVQEGQLGALIRRSRPVDASSAPLAHPPKRQITVERIDPATGERWLEAKKLAPVAGFDLVFSVPKSVSLLHALGDEETRRAVNEAHLVGVAGGARLPRGRGLRHPPRPERRRPRARRRLRRGRLPAPHEPGRRTRTCTRT